LEDARGRLHRLTATEAFEAQRGGAVIVDTRTYEQRQLRGDIPGAVVIDRTVFEWRLDPQSPWRIPDLASADARIIVICRQGYSSSLAAATLHELGLIRATDVIGGFDAWAEAGLPVVPAAPWRDPEPGPCDSVPHAVRMDHWDRVYGEHADSELSWFQPDPALSLRLIQDASPDRGARVIDVGGGTSVLVDRLLDDGFSDVAVLDVSPTAIERARSRLGDRAATVRWMVGDATTTDEVGRVDVWHDRAAFHFLTDPADRARYLSLARRSVAPGGWLILATFAPGAPPTCSGLPVRRYDAEALAGEVGDGFVLVGSEDEIHVTPYGVRQPFVFAVFRRR
jgi:rhodanese-related sulfurtransferase